MLFEYHTGYKMSRSKLRVLYNTWTENERNINVLLYTLSETGIPFKLSIFLSTGHWQRQFYVV